MSDWIVTKELDETTGEMVEVFTARPGSKAEEFCNMIDDIRKNGTRRTRPRRT